MSFGRYTARMDDVNVTTAKTLLEVTAPSTAILEIARIKVTSNSAASTASTLQVLRKSAAGTGTSFTPVAMGAYAAAGATARSNDSAEGTASTVMLDEQWNLVGGWEWVALEEFGRLIVPPSGILAVKITTAVTADYSALIEFIEKG